MKTGTLLMHQPPLPSAARSAWQVPKAWLVMPLFCGALLWMSYYPLAWGFLGWVALVPLLFLVRLETRPPLIYLGAYLAGSAFFWPILLWMPVADHRMYYTWAMLATYCSLYFPAAIFMLRRLDRSTGWPMTFTLPIVWTALEFVRSFLLTGFAWYYLGHTQHHYLPMIQAADLGGVYVISFVLAAVNGWLFECLMVFPELERAFTQRLRPRVPSPWQGLPVLGLVAAVLLYGSFRLSEEPFTAGPRIALLQGNLDQRFLNEASAASGKAVRTSDQILKYYWGLCGRALNQVPAPDLLIWPETSFPYCWLELPADLSTMPPQIKEETRLVQGLIRSVARDTKVSHLFGLNSRILNEQGEVKQYNSALLIDPQGNEAGRYDKIVRVPFGEYVPFREWLPFMNKFAPYDFDYSIRQGEKTTRFKHGAFHFGVLICNEETNPFLARKYGRAHADGPPVDFLVSMSNEGWFDGSSEHAEHMAISRFRAVETRRALARAVNMGISAIIDSNGRVQKPKEMADVNGIKVWAVVEESAGIPELPDSEWAKFTKVHGVLTATIPIDGRTSIYALTGDWLPAGCWLLVAGVWARRRFGQGVPRKA